MSFKLYNSENNFNKNYFIKTGKEVLFVSFDDFKKEMKEKIRKEIEEITFKEGVQGLLDKTAEIFDLSDFNLRSYWQHGYDYPIKYDYFEKIASELDSVKDIVILENNLSKSLMENAYKIKLIEDFFKNVCSYYGKTIFLNIVKTKVFLPQVYFNNSYRFGEFNSSNKSYSKIKFFLDAGVEIDLNNVQKTEIKEQFKSIFESFFNHSLTNIYLSEEDLNKIREKLETF